MRRTLLALVATAIVALAALVTPPRPVFGGDTVEPKRPTPIIIDIMGDGFELTDLQNGTHFDLDVSGIKEPCAWTSAYNDDAFLCLDLNNNNLIDNGGELFGSATAYPATYPASEQNGFEALRRYDLAEFGGNGDGKITSGDAVFQYLKLWNDINHNGIRDIVGVSMTPAQAQSVGLAPGITMTNELQPLSTKVLSINLAYTSVLYRDPHNNVLCCLSTARKAPSMPVQYYDVYDVLFDAGPE